MDFGIRGDISTEKSLLLSVNDQPYDTIKKEADVTSDSYGSFMGYCFAFNYVFGVGVLGIPFAFYSSGLVLGSGTLIVITLLSMVAVQWCLESLARASCTSSSLGSCQPVRITTDGMRFEMNSLVEHFLGRKFGYAYLLCSFLYLTGALVSYATVFAQSFAAHVPLYVGESAGWYTCDIYVDKSSSCSFVYWGYLIIFALIVIPYTLRDLHEQKILQFILSACRFAAIIIMSVLVIIAIYTDAYSWSRKSEDAHHGNPPYTPFLEMVKWKGIFLAFPVLLYSQIVHHSVPGLSYPVRRKKMLKRVFGSMYISTSLLYLLLAIPLSMYYGSNIEPTATLNFMYFRGGAPFGHEKPAWIIPFVFFVILFPAVDVVSAFPLNAITLGNNLCCLILAKDGEKTNEGENPSNWKNRVLRLCAAIPPMLISAFVRRLDKTLAFTGTVGIFLVFLFPAMLQLSSKRAIGKLRGNAEEKTDYTNCLSKNVFAYISVSFCVVGLFVCVVAAAMGT